MAFPFLPIAMGAAAVGSFLNARSQRKAQKQQQGQFDTIQQLLTQWLSSGQGGGSGFSQNLLNARSMNNRATDMLPDLSGLNSSTDPILQSIRRGPNMDFMGGNLRDIASTGSPFDMTQIFETLEPLRDRRRDEALAESRAGAPGLGARFGTAQRRGEMDLLRELEQENAALDASLLFQGHESAQGRRLQALNQLLGLDQQQLGRESAAMDAILRRAGVQLEGGRLGLQAQSLDDAILQLIINSGLTRRGQDLQGIGLLAGQPIPGGTSPIGSGLMDMSQLLLLSQLFGQQPGAKTT